MRHSARFHEIEHFMEGRGPSKTRVVGLLYKLFVQYQFVGDSNDWLRTPSSHKVISHTPTTTSADQVFGIFLGIRPQFSVSGIEADFHRTSFSSRFLWCPRLSSVSALC